MLRDLLGDTLQGMLEAELDTELGYSKYDYSAKETDNSRNGYSKKNVISSMGEISLDIPRIAIPLNSFRIKILNPLWQT